MILAAENRRTRRKTYSGATLSTTNPTWIDPAANPGLRGERPATNRLSRSTAHFNIIRIFFFLVLQVGVLRKISLQNSFTYFLISFLKEKVDL
jgi:hypothetical protein